jgi:hypothetical protein
MAMREEYRLRVFESKVLGRIFGRRETKWQENGESCITRSFLTYTPRQA